MSTYSLLLKETFYRPSLNLDSGVKRVRRDFVETLWSDAHTEAEWSWKSSARQKLNDFEGQILEAVDAGVKSYSGQTSWTLTNSLVYSISLISTTGKLSMIHTKN